MSYWRQEEPWEGGLVICVIGTHKKSRHGLGGVKKAGIFSNSSPPLYGNISTNARACLRRFVDDKTEDQRHEFATLISGNKTAIRRAIYWQRHRGILMQCCWSRVP